MVQPFYTVDEVNFFGNKLREISKVHEIFPNLKRANFSENSLTSIDDLLKIHALAGEQEQNNRLPETGGRP